MTPAALSVPVLSARPAVSRAFGWIDRVHATLGRVCDYPDPADASLRRAGLADVWSIHALLDGYARDGMLLPRTIEQIQAVVKDFVVAPSETPSSGIAACGALRFHSPALAEVASLAVAPGRVGQGLGRRVVRALLDEAAALGVERVFALTLDPGFFHRLGFDTTSIREFPEKLTQDCARCARRAACNEVAVVHAIDSNETEQRR